MSRGRVEVTITEKDLGMKDLKAFIKEARGLQVRAGVLGKSKPRKDHAPFTNAQIAAANEFGSEERGIPERPFMRMTWAKNVEGYKSKVVAIARAAIEGKITLRKGLSMLGLQMVKDIRSTVLEGRELEANSPATIAKKVQKGLWRLQQKKRNSKKTMEELKAEAASQVRPLVDTGAMMQAMTWEVRRGDPAAEEGAES